VGVEHEPVGVRGDPRLVARVVVAEDLPHVTTVTPLQGLRSTPVV
jgi:hypothetical protein